MKFTSSTAAALAVLSLVFGTSSAWAQQAWDPVRYLSEIERAEAAATAAAELIDGTPEHREEWLESAAHRQAARDMLRDWLLSSASEEAPDEYIEAAQGDLYACHHNVVSALVNSRYCGLANTALQLFEADTELMGSNPSPSPELLERVRVCAESALVADNPGEEDTVETDDPLGENVVPPEADILQPEPRRSSAAYAMFALAGTSAVGAFVWDRALADELAEYNRISDQCQAPSCDRSRGEELQRPLAAGRVGVAVLLGTAVISGVVGTVLVLRPDSEDSTVAFGASLRGGSVRVQF